MTTKTTMKTRRVPVNRGLSIGVVIPAKNEELFIKNCIKSLKSQQSSLHGSPLKLVVVDGNSSDATAKLARQEGITVLKDLGIGPAYARNLGALFLKQRGTDIVAFMDADTIAPPYWVDRIRAHFEKRPELIGVGGPYIPYDGKKKDKRIYALVSLGMRVLTRTGLPHFYGGNCAFRTEEFLRAGGFNEKVSMLEDMELSFRMRKLGKLEFDKHLLAFTSCRRYRQMGYLKPVYQTIRSYSSFITKSHYKTNYFDGIDRHKRC